VFGYDDAAAIGHAEVIYDNVAGVAGRTKLPLRRAAEDSKEAKAARPVGRIHPWHGARSGASPSGALENVRTQRAKQPRRPSARRIRRMGVTKGRMSPNMAHGDRQWPACCCLKAALGG